jgi:ubiquinone/menaquinone biosynthesis C-methylase UbiE
VVTRAERARSFGSIAADYDRLRPSPAAEAVDWLVAPGYEVVVDLAAGTGLLTRALAERVPRVIAVEPDPQMRAVLAARSPEVEVLEGVGEAIPLPDDSVDALFVSSAWHWLDTERAVPEIARVLHDGGRLGVLRSGRDREIEWVRDLDRLPGQAQSDGGVASGNTWRGQLVLPEGSSFAPAEQEIFPFTKRMTIDEIVELAATYSAVITATPEERAIVLEAARTGLQARFPGAEAIDFPMRTACWRTERLSR